MNASRLALVVLIVVASAHHAAAQPKVVFEVEGGGGYVFGGGAEDPGPSLAALDAAVVFWPGLRWGIAARAVRGPGEDLHDPVASLDRTFLGTGHLQYYTLTARNRRSLDARHGVEFGFGLMFGGEFKSIQIIGQPPQRRAAPDSSFGGLALEAFFTRALARHFGAKAGVTFDFNFETNNFQPVALAVVRF